MNLVFYMVRLDGVYQVELNSQLPQLQGVRILHISKDYGYEPSPAVVALFLTKELALDCAAQTNLLTVDSRWQTFSRAMLGVVKVECPQLKFPFFDPEIEFEEQYQFELRHFVRLVTVT
jgi:hypothetical protein